MDCDDLETETQQDTDTETDSHYEEDTDDSDFEPEIQDTNETSEPKLSEKQLRDLTKMLALSKENDELMVAYLKKAGICKKRGEER